LYALMYAQPGRKLLFMGAELAQTREWDHEQELDWSLLAQPAHAGVQQLVRDLNRAYRALPALHARDDEHGGFAWIEVNDSAQSVFSFVRYGRAAEPPVLVVCNLTPVVRHGYRLGVPQGGVWRELLNTDAACYGGSQVGNAGGVGSEPIPVQGHAHSLLLCLPPLAVLWLTPGWPA
jgi:1,4-alpha-glucan branching enzyme